MSLESPNEKPAKSRGARKSPGVKAGAESVIANTVTDPFKPFTDTLMSVLSGNLNARVPQDRVQADPTGFGHLLNQVLEQFSSAEHRKQVAAQEIDQALDSLIILVREGDLSRWNTSTEDPQLGPLLEGFGKVIETLRIFVREINEAALRLSSSANQVLAASTQHETSSTEQAAAIHETTATMEELKHASAQIAENAGSVARVAEETLGAARAGRGAIGEFIQAMQQIRSDGVAVADSISKLSKRVERIGTVVEVIDEIADRSDLLALNAALEGSRAGEAGKGFSIVAAEMRRLAENVLESTKEIKNLITEIREATQAAAGAADASKHATESGEKLGAVAAQAVEGILAGVQETSDAARVINLATQQQRTATEQVVASMAEIEDVTRQTTQASKQATGAAAELTQLAGRLAELIKRFKAD
ncbi:frizzy aggregation protein FrzCD [Corallococcus coralloides DSM 2259]|uniref:Frizzy aggregation protein FrzCD n=2 Tax=Corallococcus TaxID=83461 RepID=H8MR68_CORCM|nr:MULTISPECIES: methyl-accepting chemotaxis protein [Corallococcus]AFE08826.1 frizzy aggregation protein FrzCD [Corallococcus coralloides DSM 2259]RKH47840.1 methyl-accepting chemotaxis protein [Corallococcus sp. AB050B]RKH62521.1 methyl-accepting chemotaxis protein [Corallococcus interemptor]